MAWARLIFGLNILDIKDAICSTFRILMADRLNISKNSTTDFPMLGRRNPKDFLTNFELIVQMIQHPSNDRT